MRTVIPGYFFNNDWWVYKPRKEVRDNGDLHSLTEPAIIFYNTDGTVLREEWYVNGKLNSIDDKPSVVMYMKPNNKKEEWYRNNKIHRDNSPAIIFYHEDRIFKCEWYYEGNCCNFNGPALVNYTLPAHHNVLATHEYIINRLRHNAYGPAKVHYDVYGVIDKEEYWLQNTHYTKSEWIKKSFAYRYFHFCVRRFLRKKTQDNLKNIILKTNKNINLDLCKNIILYYS
jgi:hypothetical protein